MLINTTFKIYCYIKKDKKQKAIVTDHVTITSETVNLDQPEYRKINSYLEIYAAI